MRNSVDKRTLYTHVSHTGTLLHSITAANSYLRLETNLHIELPHTNNPNILEHNIIRFDIRVNNPE